MMTVTLSLRYQPTPIFAEVLGTTTEGTNGTQGAFSFSTAPDCCGGLKTHPLPLLIKAAAGHELCRLSLSVNLAAGHGPKQVTGQSLQIFGGIHQASPRLTLLAPVTLCRRTIASEEDATRSPLPEATPPRLRIEAIADLLYAVEHETVLRHANNPNVQQVRQWRYVHWAGHEYVGDRATPAEHFDLSFIDMHIAPHRPFST